MATGVADRAEESGVARLSGRLGHEWSGPGALGIVHAGLKPRSGRSRCNGECADIPCNFEESAGILVQDFSHQPDQTADDGREHHEFNHGLAPLERHIGDASFLTLLRIESKSNIIDMSFRRELALRLTMHTDHALRLLIYLARQPDRLATIREAAEAYGISRTHLTKVAHELGRGGFVETVRGRGGGLRLKGRAANIRVGDVVRAMEDDFCLVECFDPARNTCRISRACRLRGTVRQALDAYLAVLDRFTVADLIAPDTSLKGSHDLRSDPGSCSSSARLRTRAGLCADLASDVAQHVRPPR